MCIAASVSGDTKQGTGIKDTGDGDDAMDGNGGGRANATAMAQRLNADKPFGILVPADVDGNNNTMYGGDDTEYGNKAAHDNDKNGNDVTLDNVSQAAV
jgi:hypothetical protein